MINRPPQPGQPSSQPKQKGTGFTNVNRILQANQGNRLGRTVSGGIQQASKDVKTGIQQAQQKFDEEAQKKRLDTEDAANQRQAVLGRFDQQPTQPPVATQQSGTQLPPKPEGQDGRPQAQTQPVTQGTQAVDRSGQPEATTTMAPPVVNAVDTSEIEQQVQTAGPQQTLSPELGAKTSELNDLKAQLSKTASTNKVMAGPMGMGIKQVANPQYTALQKLITQKEQEITGLTQQEQQTRDSQIALETQQATQAAEAQKALDDQARLERFREIEPTEQEIADFTRFRTGTYTGPDELQDAGSLFGQASQAEQLAGLVRSSGGQQELLRRFVGGDGYTQGLRRLDQTILGQDRDANLGAAARETRGAVSDVERANEQARNQASEYIGRAKEFGQETMQQIQDRRDPLSSSVDQRIQEFQGEEEQRQQRFTQVQDIITGQGEFARIPQEQRAILGLNAAANAGLLSQDDVEALVGQGGLLQRGLNVGADVSGIISERLRLRQAENLNRQGVASEEERAKLTALDRLAGRVGTDVEFGGEFGQFQAGRGAFDYDSMNQEIMRAEDEKARNDAAYRMKMEEERELANRFFNRSLGGAMGAVGGGMNYLDSASQAILNPGEFIKDPLGNFGDTAGAIADTMYGAGQYVTNTPLALQEGLLKLNIGGKSLGDTEVGKQILNLNSGVGNLANKNMDYAFDLAKQFTSKPIDASGRVIGDAFNSAGQAVGKVGGNVKKAGRWLKKRFSDEDLKEDISYDPKDVEKFMSRIKASSYDYKDEVKDSHLASKNREIGVMAQDLEKSKLGKEAVKDTKIGKVVDYDNLGPKMLASIANLNERLKKMEGK